jgi:uncharacterized protein
MKGMDRNTGKLISDDAHLAQSISDILSTPIGSRVKRRTYGSRVMDRIDAPANAATQVLLYSDTATALMRWEPRVSVERVSITPRDNSGCRWSLVVQGKKVATGKPVSVSVPLTASRVAP